MKDKVPVPEGRDDAKRVRGPDDIPKRLHGAGIGLGESVRMQAHMLDQIGQAVIATDPDGMVIYANRAAGELYAWPPQEMLGQSIMTLTPDDPTTLQTAEEIMARLRQGESWTGEMLVQSRDGRVFPVLITNSTLFNEQGEVIGLIVVSVDFTARQRSERDQRNLAGELEAERAQLVIAQAVARVGSWETDLTTMKVTWSAETHRIFGTSPEHFEPTHEHVLELVHPDERNMMDEALQRSLQTCSPSSKEHRIVLHDGRIKYVEERWQVFQDGEGRPVRAVGTAHDITERKLAEEELARTHRAIREQASMLDAATDAIFVRDIDHRITYWNRSAERLYGWTAEEAIGQFAFDLLHHGDPEAFQTATRTVLGAGQWSGELKKRSKAGAQLTAEAAPEAGAANAPAENLPRGKNELILIVDDEPSILSVTAQTLETFGYRTLVAADGAEAIGLYALQRDEIALVITDMMMPVMDGPALIAALYRINPAVLVIGASGLGTIDSVARARHSGVTQFLAKPFSADVMLTMIRNVLDGQAPPASGASA